MMLWEQRIDGEYTLNGKRRVGGKNIVRATQLLEMALDTALDNYMTGAYQCVLENQLGPDAAAALVELELRDRDRLALQGTAAHVYLERRLHGAGMHEAQLAAGDSLLWGHVTAVDAYLTYSQPEAVMTEAVVGCTDVPEGVPAYAGRLDAVLADGTLLDLKTGYVSSRSLAQMGLYEIGMRHTHPLVPVRRIHILSVDHTGGFRVLEFTPEAAAAAAVAAMGLLSAAHTVTQTKGTT